ncbi:MAG: helix-turn-helix domain-containing protein [Anaerovibrio sp.]|nr:helix-turn-helix domain-containing protein [Anaerovibrio sp.]
MSEAFDILSGALSEVMQDVKEPYLPRHTASIKIEPIRSYSAENIKSIRKSVGVTQELFARFLGVSSKTVEAWEAGRNKPSGPSSRLLGLLEDRRISMTSL